MLSNSPTATTPGRPQCGHCGGNGYVYLWSTAHSGSRVWFCDRSNCKHFWTVGAVIDAPFANGTGVGNDLLPAFPTIAQPVLQAV